MKPCNEMLEKNNGATRSVIIRTISEQYRIKESFDRRHDTKERTILTNLQRTFIADIFNRTSKPDHVRENV